MFEGTISDNRVLVGIPADIRQAIYDQSKAEGVRFQEVMRRILREWYDLQQTRRKP